MASRISVILSIFLKHNRSTFKSPLNFYLRSKYRLASSSSVGLYKMNMSENVENIQVSKYLQPFSSFSVDQILATADSKTISVSESVSLLKALRMHVTFKGVNPIIIKNDLRFSALCQFFEKQCHTMEPNLLISGLRSLLEIGVPSNDMCIIYAQESIIKNINKFTAFNLIGCLYFHRKFLETDLQKNVVSLLTETLYDRSSEISSSAEILLLVHILDTFDKKDRNKLEEKIIKFIPILSINEICKVFSAFSNNAYRNTFILNTLSFHLRQKPEKPDIREIIDILYSFKNLNYFDMKLLTYLLKDLPSKILSSKHPSIISGILSACGHLRWKQPDILDACGEWIMKHIDSCRTRELVAYILTIATLNYITSRSQEVLNASLSYLSYEKVESSDVWLDVVWSLAVVDIVKKQILQEVVSAHFYESLISGPEFSGIINQIKLMNLKSVLKIYYPECIFACDLHLEPAKILHSSEIDNHRKQVISVLSNFIPQGKCLCTYQNTAMGIYIDAEFIMDKNMQPLPLQEYGILSKAVEVTKPLPAGSKRISLLTLFHKDFTLNDVSITGSNVLAERLLSAQGYTVVLVSFDEFIKLNSELKKTKYLFKKILDSVQIKNI